MQQWLNLVPMVGALLNLSAAMTNLAITIINRRGTTSDRADNDTARQTMPRPFRRPGPTARILRLQADSGQLSEVRGRYL